MPVSVSLCEGFQDGLLDMRRNEWIECARWNWGGCARVEEWPLSGQQLVGNAPERKLIALLADNPLKLLWCHIGWGSIGVDKCSTFEEHGDPEISQHDLSSGIEEDVGWFQITMHDAMLMGMVQGLSNLGENAYGFFYW